MTGEGRKLRAQMEVSESKAADGNKNLSLANEKISKLEQSAAERQAKVENLQKTGAKLESDLQAKVIYAQSILDA